MTKEKKTWPKVRKLFNDIHLWMGLISGIILLLVCLSGTIYVFNTELREMAAPHLYKVNQEEGQKKKDIAELLNLVKTSTGGNVSAVKIPYDTDRSYAFTVRKKESKGDTEAKGEKGHHHSDHGAKENKVRVRHHKNEKTHDHHHHSHENKKSAGNTDGVKSGQKGEFEKGGKEKPEQPRGPRGNSFMINPYSGEILGDVQGTKTATAEFMQLMFSLHRWLLLDKIEEPIFEGLENRKLGSYISGTATILFTFGVITGMIIWVPNRVRNWRKGLKIKTGGSWKRTNHDLHNTLGFYSCILLFLMGITGPQWSFDWYRDGLRKTLGTYQDKDAPKPEPLTSMITANETSKQLSFEDYLAIADKELDYKGDYSITFPKDSTSTINISKNKVGFFAPAAADKITLDQYTGAVLEKEIFKDKPFNERVSDSIKALHLGDIYGMFSKILYFIACLIATSLPVTGTLIWINKMKKKPKTI